MSSGDGQAPAWSGWPELGGPRPLDADWIDLSHPLTDRLPSPGYFPSPRFRRLMSMPVDRLNLTRLELMCHYGTHLDAPNHVIDGAPAIDEIPLERLWGPGVVWGIQASDDSSLTDEDFARARPAPSPGDMVVMRTGWADSIRTERYNRHPSLSTGAAQWLVDHRVSVVAFDFMTPEIPVPRRPADFDFPIHQVLLGGGVLIVENACVHEDLVGARVEVLMLPLPIVGADGSPIRLLARRL